MHRQQVDTLHGTAGALIVQIEFTDGIDAVAEEFDANRIAHERRKDIHDSATNGKFARRAHGLLTQVTRVCQMLGQEFLREILAARDVKDVCVELRGRDEPRRDGAYGGHDNVDLFGAELPQRCCSRLLDIRMRREARVGIRLPCRKWRYTTRALGVQLTVEVTDIGCERFDTTVLRCDDDEWPPE